MSSPYQIAPTHSRCSRLSTMATLSSPTFSATAAIRAGSSIIRIESVSTPIIRNNDWKIGPWLTTSFNAVGKVWAHQIDVPVVHALRADPRIRLEVGPVADPRSGKGRHGRRGPLVVELPLGDADLRRIGRSAGLAPGAGRNHNPPAAKRRRTWPGLARGAPETPPSPPDPPPPRPRESGRGPVRGHRGEKSVKIGLGLAGHRLCFSDVLYGFSICTSSM